MVTSIRGSSLARPFTRPWSKVNDAKGFYRSGCHRALSIGAELPVSSKLGSLDGLPFLTRDKWRDGKQAYWLCSSNRIRGELGFQAKTPLSRNRPDPELVSKRRMALTCNRVVAGAQDLRRVFPCGLTEKYKNVVKSGFSTLTIGFRMINQRPVVGLLILDSPPVLVFRPLPTVFG